MTPFRWKNCHADIAAAQHDLTIRAFLGDVIRPGIATLEARIAALGRSEDPGDAFEQSDLEDMLSETKKAFSLSAQSIWERQLGAYLSGCGEELRPGEGFATKVAKANWPGLCDLFRELRGIPIEDFPSFGELDTLHHLGNACRHGDGASGAELARRCPDWWPAYAPMPEEFGPSEPPKLTVAAMDVPADRIAGFVEAIATFWTDASYIYNESIERKHPSLEARLARERVERSWTPQARAGQD